MRLGILGPSSDDLIGLARAAQYLVDVASADKVLYLGDDGALERVVIGWAREIVDMNPSEEVLFKRAAARCARASPSEIDRFVEGERARLRLKLFVSLPSIMSRSIEILDGRVALFVYDKATLDEDDIVAASLLVYGKAQDAVVRRVGPRIFIAPGPVGSPNGGSALLDDNSGGVRIEIINGSGAITHQDFWNSSASGKMRIQGGA